MKFLGIGVGISLLVVILGIAQDDDTTPKPINPDLPKQVRVQVEYIEVSHDKMTELLQAPRNGTNDTALRTKVQDLVKVGQAKMIETQVLTAISGNRASTESVNEMVYPIEYDVPREPACTMGGQMPESQKTRIPPIPVAWDTRNLGSTLEIEPTVGEDNRVIDLRLLPILVYHVGNQVWHEETNGKDSYRMEMANFYKIQVDTSAVLMAGQPFLISAVSPKDEKGTADFTKKVLIFARADLLEVGK